MAEQDDGLSRTLKDLFAGAVGGVAQVLIGKGFLNKLPLPPFPLFCPRRVVVRHIANSGLLQVNRSVCLFSQWWRGNAKKDCPSHETSSVNHRYRKGPTPNNNGILWRSRRCDTNLQERRCFSILQGTQHTSYLDRVVWPSKFRVLK